MEKQQQKKKKKNGSCEVKEKERKIAKNESY
jgi:hypothetical protein